MFSINLFFFFFFIFSGSAVAKQWPVGAMHPGKGTRSDGARYGHFRKHARRGRSIEEIMCNIGKIVVKYCNLFSIYILIIACSYQNEYIDLITYYLQPFIIQAFNTSNTTHF